MNDDPVATTLIQSVSWLMISIAVLLALALGVQMYFDPQHKPDAALTGMLGLVVGAITQNYGQAFSFKFGSTSASKAKDDTISTLANKTGGTGNGGDGSSVSVKIDATEAKPKV